MTSRQEFKKGAGQGIDPLALLEAADPDIPWLPDLKLDPLVFDIDSSRVGEYGGFFIADDAGAARYLIPNAPGGDEWKKRMTGQSHVSGLHLPRRVRFALVAAGPLLWLAGLGQKAHYRFDAVAFCSEVLDLQSGFPALLRLAITGVPAVKLHQYFVVDIYEPLGRMTEYLRGRARTAGDHQFMDRSHYQRILERRATPQMIWIPVDVGSRVQLGRNAHKPTLGAAPLVDRFQDNGFKSLWTEVPTEMLATPDDRGGLLITGPIGEFARDHRRRYERMLRQRAWWKVRYELASIVSRDQEAP
jgi:hypothetical protein